MKRIVLGMVLLSNLVFSQTIAQNAMGCFNKSDALTANIAIMLEKWSIVKEYMASKKCILMNPKKDIKVKTIKTEYQKLGKGKAIYIQFDVRAVGNNSYPKGAVRLWLASELETYKQYPVIK